MEKFTVRSKTRDQRKQVTFHHSQIRDRVVLEWRVTYLTLTGVKGLNVDNIDTERSVSQHVMLSITQ